MALIKCPRCELNYIQEDDGLCSVCKREVDRRGDQEDALDICPLCNEHPVLAGEEYCVLCLREMIKDKEREEDQPVAGPAIHLEPVTEMQEIDLVLDDEDRPEDVELDPEEEEEEDEEEPEVEAYVPEEKTRKRR